MKDGIGSKNPAPVTRGKSDIQMPVNRLHLGMYVTALDRDWLETPFLTQGFRIENSEDIKALEKYCAYVWVKSDHNGLAGVKLTGPNERGGKAKLERSADVQEEKKRMVSAFRAARRETKGMLNNIRLGEAINTEQAKETVRACVQSIIRHPDALLWMAKIRDEREYTAEHSLNVCVLAVAFGRHLGLDENDLEKVGLCGLLHDVGKMRVPVDVLDKPERLTDKEMRMMMAHTVHGRNLLMSTPNIYPGVIDAAYGHHEKMDGTGYPRKISAKGVSLFTRMITLVDAYDAMTADRCYSKAKTSPEALKIIYQCRGTHFDEELAIKFIEAIGLYPPGCIVELCTGEVGIVLESNQEFRHLPRVILLLDEEKRLRAKEKMVDLLYVERGALSIDYLIKTVWPDGSFGISLREYQQRGLIIKH